MLLTNCAGAYDDSKAKSIMDERSSGKTLRVFYKDPGRSWGLCPLCVIIGLRLCRHFVKEAISVSMR